MVVRGAICPTGHQKGRCWEQETTRQRGMAALLLLLSTCCTRLSGLGLGDANDSARLQRWQEPRLGSRLGAILPVRTLIPRRHGHGHFGNCDVVGRTCLHSGTKRLAQTTESELSALVANAVTLQGLKWFHCRSSTARVSCSVQPSHQLLPGRQTASVSGHHFRART